MRDDIRKVTVYLPFAGFDACLTVDFEVTSWGALANCARVDDAILEDISSIERPRRRGRRYRRAA